MIRFRRLGVNERFFPCSASEYWEAVERAAGDVGRDRVRAVFAAEKHIGTPIPGLALPPT